MKIISKLVQRLKDMNIKQKDPVIIAKILSSLITKYDNVFISRCTMRVEELIHLINEEMLLKMQEKCFISIYVVRYANHLLEDRIIERRFKWLKVLLCLFHEKKTKVLKNMLIYKRMNINVKRLRSDCDKEFCNKTMSKIITFKKH